MSIVHTVSVYLINEISINIFTKKLIYTQKFYFLSSNTEQPEFGNLNPIMNFQESIIHVLYPIIKIQVIDNYIILREKQIIKSYIESIMFKNVYKILIYTYIFFMFSAPSKFPAINTQRATFKKKKKLQNYFAMRHVETWAIISKKTCKRKILIPSYPIKMLTI